ncbi:hypothetical protein QQX98_007069 [Neonectria punicea]|uniref:Zn(2)-C6 fungal-type domain-containing protein n=1 Tax=Neonectria punicea TaxID=979145 RepID=A0ABR1GZ58_9HYPO
MDPAKPKTKLSRTSTPKVQTGCITCKSRHIKCDEAKPQCINCLKKSGFCEGYAEGRLKKKRKSFPYQHCWDSKQLTQVSVRPTKPELGLDSLSFHDTAGSLYFQEFVTLVQRPWIAAAFHKDLWEVILPQLAHQSPTLCHAAMAIGAMSLWHQQTRGDALRVSQTPTLSGLESDRHYTRALSHYSYSLRLQTERISIPGAVFLSFLLLIFESLRGNRKAALDHVNHGLALLVSLLADDDKQCHIDLFALNPKPVLRAVADILGYLGIQAQSILRGRIGEGTPLPNFTKGLITRQHTIHSFNLLVDRLNPCSVDLDKIPHSFSTLDEFESYGGAAQRRFKEMNSMLLHAVHASGVLDLDTGNAIDRLILYMLQDERLRAFCERSKLLAKALDDAFLPLFNTIIASDTDPQTYSRALHLRLQCMGFYVFESPQEFIDVKSLNARTDLFREYLSLAGMTLRAAMRGAENPAHQLSLQSDLTWRLFIVTFFCRDPLVREDALWKLRDYPGHDGLWNTRSLYALALRNKAVESANAIKGAADEQWKRLWRREYVFEDGCDRIVFRYLERNPSTGDWDLVEEAATVDGQGDDAEWERRPLTGPGRPLISMLLAP